MISSLRQAFARLREFLSTGLWQVKLAGQPRWRGLLLRQLQLWTLIVREFVVDRCLLQATALAFTTLLSLVPLLALVFAVLKGIGVHYHLQPLLLEYLTAGSEPVADAIISYINNTNVGQLGAIGLVTLMLAVLSLIFEIETTFNAIWGVTETRSIARRFTSYFSVVTIGPVFVIAAVSMTGSLESQAVVQRLLDLAVVGNLLLVLFKVLPFIVMWLVLAGLYLCIPNTRVSPRAALIGGIFGGTLWQLSQWAYIHLQVGVARYNTIYGTLAALPIFMVWLYLAWAIVLLGLEMTYAVQNLRSVRCDLHGGRVSITGRTRVILAVLLHLARRFQHGASPPSVEVLVTDLEIPPRLLVTVLALLQRLGLVTEVTGSDGVGVYLPARSPETIVLAEVLSTVAGDGTDYLPPPGCPEATVVVGLVEALAIAGGGALAGVTLRDLVEQAERAEAG